MAIDLLSFRSLGALIGATGIFSAAFASHGLERIATPQGVRWWAIGAALQLVTAPVITLSGQWASSGLGLKVTPILLSLGLLLFSGSLYAMTLGAPRFLGAVTPLGGLLLAAGWISLAFR